VLPLAPGRHELRVEAPGRRPWLGSIEVAAGEVREVVVRLEAEAAAGLAPPLPAAGRPGPARPLRGGQPVRTYFWIAASLSAAATLTAGLMAWQMYSARDRYLDAGDWSSACAGTPTPKSCLDDQDSANRFGTLTLVFAGVAVAAAGVALWQWLAPPRKGAEPPRSASWRLLPVAAPAHGLLVEGRF
jgi:hypothetical protein